MLQSQRLRAEIALVILTIIWGLTFPVTRIVVEK